MICLGVWLVSISRYYHVLGTDLGGTDVAYQSIKGVRTGVLLGTLSTLIMLPIAVTLGVMAGYFKGWVDDVVQYLYTTLSSSPGILLIAASVLTYVVVSYWHGHQNALGPQDGGLRLGGHVVVARAWIHMHDRSLPHHGHCVIH